LSHEGIGVQAVAAVRPRQQVRVRFELRYPVLRVEVRGEVTWATFSGQCGIRFLDMSSRMTRRINEWIFGSLLEGALHAERAGSMFGDSAAAWSVSKAAEEEEDGLLVSAAPLKVIELPAPPQPLESDLACEDAAKIPPRSPAENDWLSQPLSGRSLIWIINGLVMGAAFLLFAVVFLSVTREPPRWPLAMGVGAAFVVAVLYWGFFQFFGGTSPGTRLARMAGCDLEDEEEADDSRFR
jgi:hypothetical protein